MITIEEARMLREVHSDNGAGGCQVWTPGTFLPGNPAGAGWYLFVTSVAGDGTRDWHHITAANAADFHTAETCPHARSDTPPVAQVRPDLADAADIGEDGYDAFGYDIEGYDRDGFDRDGRDRDGYDGDGYDADGNDRYGRNRYTSAGDLDLADEWAAYSGYDHSGFRDWLRAKVCDPDAVDDVKFCENCQEPAWELREAGRHRDICEPCWDEWDTCDYCHDRFPDDEMNGTLDDDSVCDRCRDRHYSWCDHCDGYYNDGDYDEHDHDSYDDYGNDCCSSPLLKFSIPNSAGAPLANDTRLTIELPAGTISDEGIGAIRRYLRNQGHMMVASNLEKLGSEWQTPRGNYAKRLSRLAWTEFDAKLTPEVLAQVGVIARDHSTGTSVRIEVTRDLNQGPGDFYHEDSCWWQQGYYESRCALKTNGGFGLRSFGSYGDVTGRAWVMPLRLDEQGKLVPTFETMTPDAFVVFNGYGDLSGYDPARIMAQLAGWTYRKIEFGCSPMWVNAGGYLIAPEHIAADYTDGELFLSVRQHSSLYQREHANV